jgi:hypothetical protein|tara:strand:- start:282 stop:389 length:108 start_codon:yes stop_codon:yes gene_type:complete
VDVRELLREPSYDLIRQLIDDTALAAYEVVVRTFL